MYRTRIHMYASTVSAALTSAAVSHHGHRVVGRIGDVETGGVDEFILYAWGDPRSTVGNGAEFVAVDSEGNLYGGEPAPRTLQKYVRVKP